MSQIVQKRFSKQNGSRLPNYIQVFQQKFVIHTIDSLIKMMLVIIMHPKQIIASQAEHSETDRYS